MSSIEDDLDACFFEVAPNQTMTGAPGATMVGALDATTTGAPGATTMRGTLWLMRF